MLVIHSADRFTPNIEPQASDLQPVGGPNGLWSAEAPAGLCAAASSMNTSGPPRSPGHAHRHSPGTPHAAGRGIRVLRHSSVRDRTASLRYTRDRWASTVRSPSEQLSGDLSVGATCGNQVGYALLSNGEDLPCSRRSGVCSHAAEFVPDSITPPTVGHRADRRSPGQPEGTPRPCAYAVPAGEPPRPREASVPVRTASAAAGASRAPQQVSLLRRRDHPAPRGGAPGTGRRWQCPIPGLARAARASNGLSRASALPSSPSRVSASISSGRNRHRAGSARPMARNTSANGPSRSWAPIASPADQGRNPEGLRRHGGEQRHARVPRRVPSRAPASRRPSSIRPRHACSGPRAADMKAMTSSAAGVLSQAVTFSGQLLGPPASSRPSPRSRVRAQSTNGSPSRRPAPSPAYSC